LSALSAAPFTDLDFAASEMKKKEKGEKEKEREGRKRGKRNV